MTKNASIDSIQKISWLLDKSIPLPGGYKIGIDGLLGLLPIWGDAAGLILSGIIVWHGIKLNVSKSTLFRMFGNIIIDVLVGIIPIFGDFFDFIWKANDKNIQLLLAHSQNPNEVRKESRFYFCLFFLLLFGTIILLLWFGFKGLTYLIQFV